VIIVDEFTGRTMPGRRWSDGLHQAVEAKEGVKVQQEQKTIATITVQNYFRQYEKLAGMTPEQLMEIPGIGEKMVDKIYQAVNRFYEGGGEAAAAGEAAENAEGSAEEVAPSDQAEASAEGAAVETPEAEVESEGTPEAAPEPHDEAAAPAPAENDAAGSDGVRTAEIPEEGDQKHSESDEEAKS